MASAGELRMEEDFLLLREGEVDSDYVAELEEIARSDEPGDATPRRSKPKTAEKAGESATKTGELEAVVLRLFRDTLMPQIAARVQGETTPVRRKALCCIRPRRRLSRDSVPLTHVGIVPNQEYGMNSINEFQEWSEWDNSVDNFGDPKTRTIQQQIEIYRKQAVAARQMQNEQGDDQQEDLFGDMAPQITKQKKVFVSVDSPNNGNSARFNMEPDLDVNIQSGELGEWEEGSSWEDQTLDHIAREALIEKRRQQRERRAWEQHQKRQEKNRHVSLGARLNA